MVFLRFLFLLLCHPRRWGLIIFLVVKHFCPSRKISIKLKQAILLEECFSVAGTATTMRQTHTHTYTHRTKGHRIEKVIESVAVRTRTCRKDKYNKIVVPVCMAQTTNCHNRTIIRIIQQFCYLHSCFHHETAKRAKPVTFCFANYSSTIEAIGQCFVFGSKAPANYLCLASGRVRFLHDPFFVLLFGLLLQWWILCLGVWRGRGGG